MVLGGGQGRPLKGGGLNELVCVLSCPAGWCLARGLGARCQCALGGPGCTPPPLSPPWPLAEEGAGGCSGAFATADRWAWSGLQGSGWQTGEGLAQGSQVFVLHPVDVVAGPLADSWGLGEVPGWWEGPGRGTARPQGAPPGVVSGSASPPRGSASGPPSKDRVTGPGRVVL